MKRWDSEWSLLIAIEIVEAIVKQRESKAARTKKAGGRPQGATIDAREEGRNNNRQCGASHKADVFSM